MKKVALVFVIAVILPSLALAWLAVRSLRDQQFLLERQQSLLCQRATDSLAKDIADYLAQRQQEFSAQVENLVGDNDAREIGSQFDNEIRRRWPMADVGFCVTLSGKILSPLPNSRPDARTFYYDNSGFLGNREAVEVYRNSAVGNQLANGRAEANAPFPELAGASKDAQYAASAPAAVMSAAPPDEAVMSKKMAKSEPAKPAGITASQALKETPPTSSAQQKSMYSSASDAAMRQQNTYKQQARKVSPQQTLFQADVTTKNFAEEATLSKAIPAEAEFAQLVGADTDGMLARFLQNKLKLMFWHRLHREPDLIFGAELNLTHVVNGLRGMVRPEPPLEKDICIALLDDNAKPVAISRPNFSANWKRPFVATEIGDALPHWEVAAYLINPAALTYTACIAEISLGLLIAILVLAIVIGSWLIVRNLNIELVQARQKTDFVSNVSHELKTPLTSIRMFSELLAEGRVADPAKQRSYLQIITAEAARLTRLINNVLDFSRMERGEKKYDFQACNLAEIVQATADTFRPHLEANGFRFECGLPAEAVSVRGDADALSQIIVNLLSNAEKYSKGGKEIAVHLTQKQSPLPHAEIRVLDRGAGVPRGSEEKVFEKFYRAHDSLSSGVQGSGLGLTIARQIARAHGGDIVYEHRDGGGSCFVLRLPISTTDKHG
jgi:signal transduction histidine kinase